MNLTPSASGCKSPKGPTRVGPQRFWIRADTLRSSQTLYATAVSRTKTTATDLISEMMTNVVTFNCVRVARALLPAWFLIFLFDLPDCGLVPSPPQLPTRRICSHKPNLESLNTGQACPS